MRSFVLWAVMTSLGKNNLYWLILNSNLTFFQKKRLEWFRLFATTFLPLGLTLFNLIFVLLQFGFSFHYIPLPT
jgi:hypothetical protein